MTDEVTEVVLTPQQKAAKQNVAVDRYGKDLDYLVSVTFTRCIVPGTSLLFLGSAFVKGLTLSSHPVGFLLSEASLLFKLTPLFGDNSLFENNQIDLALILTPCSQSKHCQDL